MAEETNTTAETNEVVGEADHAEDVGALGTLGIDGGIFVAQLINFLIVLIVLWKFAYKPIIERLDKRTETIEKGLKNAEEAEKRLIELETERKEILATTKSEAVQILEDAREQADEQKKTLVAAAKQDVERVVTQGKEQLQSEKESMIRDARKDIIEIAIAASAKVLSEKIDDKKSRELAEKVVEQMS